MSVLQKDENVTQREEPWVYLSSSLNSKDNLL